MDALDTEVKQIILTHFSDASNPTEAVIRLTNLHMEMKKLSK